MNIAICPGSFDPITFGHLDVIQRAADKFDEVVVGIILNTSKTEPLFDLEIRKSLVVAVTADIPNARVDSFRGLLVDFCRKHGAGVIVKGLRAVSDFDYELQMAQMNQKLSGIETFFVSTAPEHSFLSSSLVRDVALYGGDVSSMVPPIVAEALAGLNVENS